MKFGDAGKFLFAALKTMVPQVAQVEADIKQAKSGPQKKEAVIAAVLHGLAAAHDLTGKDLLGHPKVVQVLGKVNDVMVEAHNDLVKVAEEAAAEQPPAAPAPSASAGTSSE